MHPFILFGLVYAFPADPIIVEDAYAGQNPPPHVQAVPYVEDDLNKCNYIVAVALEHGYSEDTQHHKDEQLCEAFKNNADLPIAKLVVAGFSRPTAETLARTAPVVLAHKCCSIS